MTRDSVDIVKGVFTPMQREVAANTLIAAAESTDGIVAGAVVGPAAIGALDPEAGIDLLFAAAPEFAGAALEDLRAQWIDRVYRDVGAVHHTEEEGGTTVHLLPDLLTARTALVPVSRFGPRGGLPFRQVFGAAGPQGLAPSASIDLVGPAWLAALRVRAALLRNDAPSAAVAFDALRAALIALAGARTGAPPGFLEPADRDRIRATETGSRDPAVIRRAFALAVEMLDAELQVVAPAVADAVALPLLEELAG